MVATSLSYLQKELFLIYFQRAKTTQNVVVLPAVLFPRLLVGLQLHELLPLWQGDLLHVQATQNGYHLKKAKKSS
jgi:hypothetical protein